MLDSICSSTNIFGIHELKVFNPKSQHLFNQLKSVELADSTYTSPHPRVFSKAIGSELFDADGKRYIDFCAGFGALALGHGHSTFNDACAQDLALTQGYGDVYATEDKVELFKVMRSVLPTHFAKGALAVTGGQSVEIALKTIALAKKKSGIIAFEGAYHGLDIGALPVTHRRDFREPFLFWWQDLVEFLPYNCSHERIEAAIARLAQKGLPLGGIIVEPIQGRGGCIAAETRFLLDLRATCDQHDALLVYDEVQTGLGRTGRWVTTEPCKSDIVCLGKILGGGLPLSACWMTEMAAAAWPESSGEALHTGTFFGHALCCRTAARALAFIRDQNLLNYATNLGQEARAFLRQNLGSHARDVRGEGLMMAIEFAEDGLGARLMEPLADAGLIVIPSGPTGSCLGITPALNIKREIFWEGLRMIVGIVQ